MRHHPDGQDTFKTIERSFRSGVERILKTVNRRRFGRLNCGWVHCNLGRVLDLSAGGMRLLSDTELAGEVDLELRQREERLMLRAEVSWSKRSASGGFEIGLDFFPLTEDDARLLSTIATSSET